MSRVLSRRRSRAKLLLPRGLAHPNIFCAKNSRRRQRRERREMNKNRGTEGQGLQAAVGLAGSRSQAVSLACESRRDRGCASVPALGAKAKTARSMSRKWLCPVHECGAFLSAQRRQTRDAPRPCPSEHILRQKSAPAPTARTARGPEISCIVMTARSMRNFFAANMLSELWGYA